MNRIRLSIIGLACGIACMASRPAAAQDHPRELRRVLNRLLIEHRRMFEQSPDYAQARQAVAAAWRDYSAARQEAVRRLDGDPAYRAAWMDWQRVRDELDDARRQRRASERLIFDLAVEVMRRRGVLSAMERDVLERDEAVSAARFAAMDAGAMLRDLEREWQDSVALDPQLSAVRDRLREPRVYLASGG